MPVTIKRFISAATGIDFVYEKAGWFEKALHMALNPPPGTALLVVIVGLVLIYWTTKPREIRMSAPIIGMLACFIGFAGFGIWYLVRNQSEEPTNQHDPPSQSANPSVPSVDILQQEVQRRSAVLAKLADEYFVIHPDQAEAIKKGALPAPIDWTNGRLKELGEVWKIAAAPNAPQNRTPSAAVVIDGANNIKFHGGNISGGDVGMIVRNSSDVGTRDTNIQGGALSPAPPVVYTERDIRELLDALAEAQKLVDEVIAPPFFRVESLAANAQGLLLNGVQNFAQQLTDLREQIQTEVWPKINKFVYETNVRHKDEMRYALALDEEAAKGEVVRKLDIAIEAIKLLPQNSTPQTNKLVEPQLKDVRSQIQPAVYRWIGTARTRIANMTNDLRTKGVIAYEKK
jgi:hypothetical protein